MISTPENTAVVTILAYTERNDIPLTVNFMQASAKKNGISLMQLLQGQNYIYNEKEIDMSFDNKLIRLWSEVKNMPSRYTHILYLDARDTLFVRGLGVICRKYNEIGWPIVISASRVCQHHRDPGWHARFGKHASGWDYINAGVWMAERQALSEAIEKMTALSALVKDDKIASSYPALWNNDQHLWQTAYVEHSFPLRVDFDRSLFCNYHQTPFADLDYSKSTPETPVVLKNGQAPCIVHLAGMSAEFAPVLAWFLGIVKPPEIPALDSRQVTVS